MHLYNNLTREIQPFTPHGDTVSVYVCGITPYATTHLGHAFTYTTFDILIRYLEFQGYPVRYVQNVTDIDDDILQQAGKTNEDWFLLGNRWTAHFIEDLISLNVRPPDYFPRATDVIPDIIQFVADLLERGVAYVGNGHVYFDLDAYSDYGHLSQIPRSEMLPIANERGNRPDDPGKRDPLDFVLWQAGAPGEPAWESPWGLGRPGWHIECSTMARKYLGDVIDIHGGGADLIFPHHESEIAQAECATMQKPFVRFWMHTAMVYHDGEKMSKSLGNLVMMRDLLEEFSADALRLYMASHHYRREWSYNEDELRAAAAQAERLRSAAEGRQASSLGHAGWAERSREEELEAETWRARFVGFMDDDLNTPQAVQVLDDLARALLSAAAEGQKVQRAQHTLRELSQILGLRLDGRHPEERVVSGWGQHLPRFTEQTGPTVSNA